MGEISGNLADLTIVTEDNSRFEDVNDIMNYLDVLEGREARSYGTKIGKSLLFRSRNKEFFVLLQQNNLKHGSQLYLDCIFLHRICGGSSEIGLLRRHGGLPCRDERHDGHRQDRF